MRRVTFVKLVAVLSTAFAAACGIFEPEDVDELGDARLRWELLGFTSYEYRLTRFCFCITRPYLIRVIDGRVVEVRDAETGVVQPDYDWAETVPELFDMIVDAMDRDAESLVVEYHPQLGYPTQISIDYEAMIADDEITVRAEALRSLR